MSKPEAYPLVDAPLPHHLAGLQYTASGYGKKIPTSKMVKYQGRLRRIYCTIYSNAGTCWIIVAGKKRVVHQSDDSVGVDSQPWS